MVLLLHRVYSEPFVQQSICQSSHAKQKCDKPSLSFITKRRLSIQRLQLRDHPLDHAKPALPECRIAGVEPEGRKQFRMMLGASGREHFEVTLCEARSSALVYGIERIHQAIPERIGI